MRFCRLSMGVFWIATLTLLGCGEKGVVIPDSALRATIEDGLGKSQGETITSADMKTLLSLDISSGPIFGLTGLEYATNLTALELRSNGISYIMPLSGLTNLTTLYLYKNRISDITPLMEKSGLN